MEAPTIAKKTTVDVSIELPPMSISHTFKRISYLSIEKNIGLKEITRRDFGNRLFPWEAHEMTTNDKSPLMFEFFCRAK
jgi:hypothetical protein